MNAAANTSNTVRTVNLQKRKRQLELELEDPIRDAARVCTIDPEIDARCDKAAKTDEAPDPCVFILSPKKWNDDDSKLLPGSVGVDDWLMLNELQPIFTGELEILNREAFLRVIHEASIYIEDGTTHACTNIQ